MGREPNNLEMILLRQKAGQQLKDSTKVIEFPQKESFMKQVEAMKRSGDIVDPNNLKKNDNVLTREMFQDSNLNKVEPVNERFIDYTIQDIKTKEPTDGMKIVNRIIKREGEYKDLTKEQSKRILKETDDHLTGKNKPEDKADGGRIGFKAGKFVFDKVVAKFLKNQKKLQEAVDDIFPTGDYKYDAEMAADALVENNPQIFKNLLREDLPDEVSSEIYGAVLRPITNNMAKMRELRKATRPEKTLQSMKEGKGIDMSNPDIADEFGRFMKETDPEGYKKLEQTVELSNFDPKKVKGNAEGGRIGYQEGGGIESRLEQLGGDVTSAEQLLQQINERIQSAESNLGEGGGSGLMSIQPSNFQPRQMPIGQPGLINLADIQPGTQPMLGGIPQKSFDQMNPAEKLKAAQGRNMQQDVKLGPLQDYLNEVIKTKGETNMLYPNLPDRTSALPGSLQPAESYQSGMQSPLLQQQNLARALPGLFAKGGRAGFYTGGITDVEPSLDDIGHGSDSLMSRTRLMSPGSQTTTSTGLNYLLAEDNDNLRVPFAGGGDPRRRAFLKLMATLGGGIAGIKTGLLGLGEGTGKKAVTETIKQSAGSGRPPPYFFKLVEKIKFMGDDVTEKAATQEREIVKRYKDYEMTEDIGTGNIVIKKRNEGSFYDQDGIISDEYIVYKPGQADELTKGKKPPPEYDEYTVRPDGDGKLRDSEDGLDSIDEILEEVGDPDSMTLKKADGGRIGYNIGGLSKLGITGSSRKFLEKVFGKQKFQDMIENDPELHRGMLEVVEMFRSKDKTGLVEYMQNFLPQMSKKELEAFVVGSGDTAGIEGQLIRLGSGRDYKNKIEMIEESNNLRKLKDFDVEGVSKNAEGGRIELKGGGDALKALIKYYANKKGVKGSTFLKDINPKTLPEGIENILGPEQLKALQINQTDYVQSLLNIMKSDKNFLNNLKANTEEAIAQAPIGMEAYAKEITESIKRDAMKGSRFDRFKVYDKIDIDDAIVDVEQMIKNRRIKESDGRALNASGGLQTMLGE